MVDPAPVADPILVADLTHSVPSPVIAHPQVHPISVYPLPFHPLLVSPLLVRPPSVADTLRGMLGGRLLGLDDHTPPAKWVAQSWPIWHHHGFYIGNCVRYFNKN